MSIVLPDIKVDYNPVTNTLVALYNGASKTKKAISIAIPEEAALLAETMTHLPIDELHSTENNFVFRIRTK